jgi:two-component system cell cycle sensor histidine kinase/response regulator CckA
MIPEWVVVVLAAVSSAALAAGVAVLLAHGVRRAGPVGMLLLGITAILLVVAGGNILKWTGLAPNADIVEDFVWPLVPILYLFLFVVGIERADRGRLERLNKQLAESEAQFRLLVENAQVAIAVVDADRKITFWNRGVQDLLGWSAEETLGRCIDLLYAPEHLAGVRTEILPALQRDGLWFGEFPLIRKDGVRLTAFMSLGRVFDANHRAVCTLGVLSDVTERVLLREQLIQAQKMETLAALAGGIAHDFSNLLTAISGFASLLKDSLAPGSDELDSAVSIEQAAQRGTQLVRQLMAFSHRQPTQTEPVDLNGIVAEVADLAQRTFPRNIKILTRLATDLAMVSGDSGQVHQVVMNLAINARDAMPKGGQLTLSTENFACLPDDPRGAGMKHRACVCLSVADTGTGIPPNVQPHVFDPFFTTKPVGGGTGLGLSTVFAIARRHDGRVTFATQVDRGTTFYVVLPAMAAQQATSSDTDTPSPADAQ